MINHIDWSYMTNHKVYFKKSDDFWGLWLIIHDFKKSDNVLLFWLIIYDFFSKYNRTGVNWKLTCSKFSKQSLYQVSENIEVEKKI